MTEDPKRVFVEMVGRLSRETQLHLDESHFHYQVNKWIVIIISILLMVVAVVNVYYIKVLYSDLNGIITNMDSMHVNMQDVSAKMQRITDDVKVFEISMQHMVEINAHTSAMAKVLPRISENMTRMVQDMGTIEQGMGEMNMGMTNMAQRVAHMTGGVAIMRNNVHKIAGPMGAMNPFMP